MKSLILLLNSMNNNKTWFTADHHFSHFNIIRYCSRPFASIEEMNEEMARRWNALVEENDLVYHLGDFAFGLGEVEKWKQRLNGEIILIAGNHDCFPHKKPQLLERYRKLFKEVCFEKIIEIEGRKIKLHHYPYQEHVNEKHHLIRPEKSEEDFLLCGHIHEKWHKKGTAINVGVDRNNFSPISVERVIELMDCEGNS